MENDVHADTAGRGQPNPGDLRRTDGAEPRADAPWYQTEAGWTRMRELQQQLREML
jgi:hypothetical protein